MDIELGGEVDAQVERGGRRHDHDADIQVGDVEADGVGVQFRRVYLMVAVGVRPVRPVHANERSHVGRADGHRRDGLGAAVGERHFLRRPELESDAAGEEEIVEDLELDEALRPDERRAHA